MSLAVKQRKAAQRKTLTIGKLKDGIIKQQQAVAKNDPFAQARLSLATRERTVSYGGLYGRK